MIDEKVYGNYKTSWCPGCGNFGVMTALKKALAKLDVPPQGLLMVSGIGQAAKGPHYIACNAFNGLHGRSLPVAAAAKIANRDLVVIAQSGDGCHYGEGGNHFLHALRRNVDITILAHDNKVYGLTKGQASPTSDRGFKSKEQPLGTPSEPFNPLAVAVILRAGFVAQGFAGDIPHLAEMIVQAIQHRGVSLVNILQPCVSFNHVQTWGYYQERVKPIEESHNPRDWAAAIKKTMPEEDGIPLGVIYKNDRPAFEDHFPVLTKGALIDQQSDPKALREIMESFS